MMQDWWAIGLVSALVLVVLVVAGGIAIVVILLWQTRPVRATELPRLHGMELILAERLARGEIDESEFLLRRHALLADRHQAGGTDAG